MAGQVAGGDRMRYEGRIYRGPNQPCKDCQKRHYACHDTCEEFIQARTEWVEHKRVIRNNKRLFTDLNSFEVEGKLKGQRKKRR